ncbi:MAG: ribonuclease III [Flavobacteriales bacterium]|nr:ribonuclease III [Flavobacteriales bacterium]
MFARWWNQRSLNERQIKLSNYVYKHFRYYPKKIEFYETALRHSSASKRIKGGLKNSNERLEFLGDTVLDMVVADYLYKTYPTKPEGELTKMKAKVVNRKTLNRVASNIGLNKVLQKKLQKLEKHQSVLGNALEALAGAMYLDLGYPKSEKLLLKLLLDNGMKTAIHAVSDHKSRLHEWCQKNKRVLEFNILLEEQAAGKSKYEVEVRVDGEVLGEGKGKSKKSAEQEASKIAWKILKIEA